MNFDEISYINIILQKTIEGDITWSLSKTIPRVIDSRSEMTVTSCYQSSTLRNGIVFYIYRYRIPEYYGDHDSFYNVEKVKISAIVYDQISWQSTSDSSPIYNLMDYISSTYSGINNLF